MNRNVKWCSCNVAVILVRLEWNLKFLDKSLKNTQIWNLEKIRPVGAKLFHADRQTAVKKLIVVFRNFADTPENMVGLTIVWLVAFAQLGRAPISFVMSVRLSACINAVPTGPISVKFDTGDVYENLSRKARLKKKLDKNHFMWRPKYFFFVPGDINTLRTGLLNCLNARSRGLTFRQRASCI